jgi:hypothetical protein
MLVLLILLLFFIENIVIGTILFSSFFFFFFADIALCNIAVIAAVTITTGQDIGFAYSALVMAMHKN